MKQIFEDGILYRIDENNKTVTGVYKNENDEHIFKLIDNVSKYDADLIYNLIEHNKFPKYPIAYTATATCDSKDKFDPNIGKKIVKHKIDVKRHKRAYQEMKQMHRILIDLYKKIRYSRNYHFSKACKIEGDYERFYLGVNTDE